MGLSSCKFRMKFPHFYYWNSKQNVFTGLQVRLQQRQGRASSWEGIHPHATKVKGGSVSGI